MLGVSLYNWRSLRVVTDSLEIAENIAKDLNYIFKFGSPTIVKASTELCLDMFLGEYEDLVGYQTFFKVLADSANRELIDAMDYSHLDDQPLIPDEGVLDALVKQAIIEVKLPTNEVVEFELYTCRESKWTLQTASRDWFWLWDRLAKHVWDLGKNAIIKSYTEDGQLFETQIWHWVYSSEDGDHVATCSEYHNKNR